MQLEQLATSAGAIANSSTPGKTAGTAARPHNNAYRLATSTRATRPWRQRSMAALPSWDHNISWKWSDDGWQWLNSVGKHCMQRWNAPYSGGINRCNKCRISYGRIEWVWPQSSILVFKHMSLIVRACQRLHPGTAAQVSHTARFERLAK